MSLRTTMKWIFFRGLQADPLVIPLYIVLNQLIGNTELRKSVGLLQAFVPMAGSSWVLRFWSHCLVPRSKAWLTCARWGAIEVCWFLRQALPFFLSLHWQKFVTNCPFFAHLGTEESCADDTEWRWTLQEKSAELKTQFLMEFFQIEKFLFPWCSCFEMGADRQSCHMLIMRKYWQPEVNVLCTYKNLFCCGFSSGLLSKTSCPCCRYSASEILCGRFHLCISNASLCLCFVTVWK